LSVVRRAIGKSKHTLNRLRGANSPAGSGPPAPGSAAFRPPPMTVENVARLLYFQRFFTAIEHLDGDVVECGVGYGNSLVMLSILAKREGCGRRVWGFDSFEGFPAPTPEDESPRNPQPGEWHSDLDSVVRKLQRSGLDSHFTNRQATLVPGFFEDSLHLFRGKGIALLHLDCDLYSSYRYTLETLYPLVQSGGIVAFDEYVNTGQLRSFPGAQRAIDEYFGEQRDLIVADPDTGQYYLVKP
jgi:O-methyltransferase